MKIVWYCPFCNWVSVSDSKLRHCMDYCKCQKCAIDLEEGYARFIGNPIRLATYKNNKWKRNRK